MPVGRGLGFTSLLTAFSIAVAMAVQASGCSLLSSKKPPRTASAKPEASATPAAPTPEETPGLVASVSSDAAAAEPSPTRVSQGEVVAHVIASVDGEPITARDVEQFSAAVGRPVKTDDIANNEDAKAALKALISQKLLQKEIEQYSSKVDEDQVDRYVDAVRQDKHLTPEQFKAALAQSGLSMDDFRKHAREELEKEVMIREQVRQKVNISNADIKAYYDEHKADFTVTTERLKLAQILVGVPQNATTQQVAMLKAKADKIQKQAAAGADFAALAHKYSDDVSRNNGGELGWFTPQDIMDQVYTAVKNLKPGDVSQVVRTDHGFHILKLEEHQVPGLRPLEDVRAEIRNRLIDERANAQLQTWINTDLVKQHDVETLY
jgi:peptidyl-prolyl cis-trans isomerase SurA